MKAQEMAKLLASRLSTLGLTVAESTVSGNPAVGVGNPAGGGGNGYFWIEIRPLSWAVVPNVLGGTNYSDVYSPHVAMVAMEADAGAGTGVDASYTPLLLARVLGNVVATGCQLEVYLSANNVTPVTGSITGAPAGSYLPDAYWPWKSQ